MKMKNLTFVEKYIEKVVLAVSIVVSLVVVWFYVLHKPYHVELKSYEGQGEMSPSKVEDNVRIDRIQLNRSIAEGAPSPIPDKDLKVPDWLGGIEHANINASLVPLRYTHLLGQPGLDKRHVEIDADEPNPFLVPVPPPVVAIRTLAGFGLLAEPRDQNLRINYVRRIGPQIPRDFRWVSIDGRFNMRRWRDRLQRQPDDPEKQRKIPRDLWDKRLAIVGVVLERQKWDPRADDWGPTETIDPMPEGPLPFHLDPGEWAPAAANQARAQILEQRQWFARPPFPPLAEGLWLPPGADVARLDPNEQEQYIGIDKEIRWLQQRLQELRLGGMGAAPVDPCDDIDDTVDAGGLSRQQQLDLKIGALLRLFGVEVAGAGVFDGGQDARELRPGEGRLDPGPGADQVGIEDERDFFSAHHVVASEVNVWAHDISVQPGVTYRYRLTAYALSPLFFGPEEDDLPRQQKHLRHKIALAGESSDWSGPVTIEPALDWYLVGANAQKRQATVEVYGILEGRRAFRRFTIEVGDAIGQTVRLVVGEGNTTMDMSVGAIVVDLDFQALASGRVGARTTLRMTYQDNLRGKLSDRFLDVDMKNPERQHKNREAGGEQAPLAPEAQ